jgi:hypothetical protein
MTGSIIDLAPADYYADKIDDRPSLNASIAKVLLNESPLHAWTPASQPELRAVGRPQV